MSSATAARLGGVAHGGTRCRWPPCAPRACCTSRRSARRSRRAPPTLAPPRSRSRAPRACDGYDTNLRQAVAALVGPRRDPHHAARRRLGVPSSMMRARSTRSTMPRRSSTRTRRRRAQRGAEDGRGGCIVAAGGRRGTSRATGHRDRRDRGRRLLRRRVRRAPGRATTAEATRTPMPRRLSTRGYGAVAPLPRPAAVAALAGHRAMSDTFRADLLHGKRALVVGATSGTAPRSPMRSRRWAPT